MQVSAARRAVWRGSELIVAEGVCNFGAECGGGRRGIWTATPAVRGARRLSRGPRGRNSSIFAEGKSERCRKCRGSKIVVTAYRRGLAGGCNSSPMNDREGHGDLSNSSRSARSRKRSPLGSESVQAGKVGMNALGGFVIPFLGGDGKEGTMGIPLLDLEDQSGRSASPGSGRVSRASSYRDDKPANQHRAEAASMRVFEPERWEQDEYLEVETGADGKAPHATVPAPGSRGASAPWLRTLPHVLCACLGAVLFGYHMGVINGPMPYFAKDLGFGNNSVIQGLVVSIFVLGAFIGCAASSTFADSFGCRRAFQLASLPMLVGTACSAMARTVTPMLIGRCLCGLGLGAAIPVLALYVSEISPTPQRGAFGALVQVATCVGILGAMVASLPLPYIEGWWRTCFWLAALPASVLLVGMQVAAESPRWLAKRGRWNDVSRTVNRLWGASSVRAAVAELEESTEKQAAESEASWGAVFGSRYIRVLILGSAAFAFQQLAGINAIFYFSSTIFRKAGVTSDLAASTVVGLVNLTAAVMSTFLMDELGRKKLLIGSFAGMGLSMAIQAFFSAVPALAGYAPIASLLGMLTYVAAFAMGAGPVPAILLSEIFPSLIRTKGIAIAMCVHWMCNFIVGFSFLPLIHAWGAPGVYSLFSAICFSAVVFTRTCLIETKGRSLEELERVLIAG